VIVSGEKRTIEINFRGQSRTVNNINMSKIFNCFEALSIMGKYTKKYDKY
jgi:hypothetical protein